MVAECDIEASMHTLTTVYFANFNKMTPASCGLLRNCNILRFLVCMKFRMRIYIKDINHSLILSSLSKTQPNLSSNNTRFFIYFCNLTIFLEKFVPNSLFSSCAFFWSVFLKSCLENYMTLKPVRLQKHSHICIWSHALYL